MNYSTAVFLINENIRAIACTYEREDNAPRTIFKTPDQSIKVGDFVVVPTDTRHKMTVVKVMDVDVDVDFDSSKQMDWIVATVSTDYVQQLNAQEAEAIKQIKSAELRKKKRELAAAVLEDRDSIISSLPIAHVGETPALEAPLGGAVSGAAA